MNENKLTKRIEELFADGQITLAIGYEMGTSGPRPFFCRSAQDASRMVFSNDFPNNLAVYLTKKEVVAGEKVAVAATVSALRSIAYLFRENQVGQNQFTILHLSPNDELMHFRTPSDIDVYIDHIPSEPSERDREILEKLEAMTCVCSVGLDMIAIPGDTPAETIAAIIADEAAIGMVNGKTTAVRVIPAPGTQTGDRVEFGGLLGHAPVIPVRPQSAADFIHRGGRIPAPLHSLRN